MSAELQPEPLPAKKCPACGKPCIERYSRKFKKNFMGCPDYPKCPGKAGSMSGDQRKDSAKKLAYAYRFINAIGSCKEAERWLRIATHIVAVQKQIDTPIPPSVFYKE